MREKISMALLGRGHINSISRPGAPHGRALGQTVPICFLAWATGLMIGETSGMPANARIEPGMYMFISSVLGSMIIFLLLKRAVLRLQTVKHDTVEPRASS